VIDAPWEIATTLNNLAIVMASRGDFRRASELFEEDLAIYRRLGVRRGVAMALNNLGELAQNQGEYERAGDLLSEGLLLNVEAGNRRAIAYGLECFASLLAARGVADRSLRLAAAADGLREQIGSALSPAEREDLERSIATARAALGAEAASNAWSSGRELTIVEAVSVALATTEGGYDSGALGY
jgi:tetratricopeptide (TPR) repeat protein